MMREMQIKNKMRYHYISMRIAKIKKDWPYHVLTRIQQNKELSYAGGGNVQWKNHFGKEFDSFLKR